MANTAFTNDLINLEVVLYVWLYTVVGTFGGESFVLTSFYLPL